jgi:hypothetical protein
MGISETRAYYISMTTPEIVLFIFSIIGGVLGATSFYLTQVRRSKIIVIVEKRIRIGYCDGGDGFQFYVPVTFINTTHQTGIIREMQMTICSMASPGVIYKIDLARFSTIDSANKFLDNELPHAIAVSGKSSVNKVLRFSWWNASIPKMVLNEPSYRLAFKFWTTNKRKNGFVQIEHKLFLNRHVLAELENFRATKMGLAMEVRFDGESPNNELITKDWTILK